MSPDGEPAGGLVDVGPEVAPGVAPFVGPAGTTTVSVVAVSLVAVPLAAPFVREVAGAPGDSATGPLAGVAPAAAAGAEMSAGFGVAVFIAAGSIGTDFFTAGAGALADRKSVV